VRIALVYDCVYPQTVGGAERWLRKLAEALGEEHEVTYVTRRQWPPGKEPSARGVRWVGVAPGGDLYRADGRRRVLPALAFAAGVFVHFLRRRGRYDVVHCLSYPFFPLIALRIALAGRGDVRIFCEWLEYLTADYWRRYAGQLGGLAGRGAQRLCLRMSPAAFVFSDLVRSRLIEAGYSRPIYRLAGLWAGPPDRTAARGGSPPAPLVLFAGRHVPDKRVTALPEAIRLARRRHPALRASIVGDGPERPRLLEQVERLGLRDAIDCPGFIGRPELDDLMTRASCLVSPSSRDGHGMVVAEAAAFGTPVVVCRHPDSAATELVSDGVNGAIAESAAAEQIADAIARVLEGGQPLRESTADWFDSHVAWLSMDASVERVREAYDA